ncbi:MAG: CRISPR-associated endonuclease Cas2, partial [Zoogloeaceae bacterium]|nr:CRISPR-associated endonuclease Cas2 [Zoogloeaceae bacterium]
PKRLNHVHRFLVNQAMPIEYSVFLFFGTQKALESCLAGLKSRIDANTDDVRAYPLPQRGLKLCLGRAVLPEGIYQTALPEGFNAL